MATVRKEKTFDWINLKAEEREKLEILVIVTWFDKAKHTQKNRIKEPLVMGNKCCSKRQPEDSFNPGLKNETSNVWKPGKNSSIDSRYTPDPVSSQSHSYIQLHSFNYTLYFLAPTLKHCTNWYHTTNWRSKKWV